MFEIVLSFLFADVGVLKAHFLLLLYADVCPDLSGQVRVINGDSIQQLTTIHICTAGLECHMKKQHVGPSCSCDDPKHADMMRQQ